MPKNRTLYSIQDSSILFYFFIEKCFPYNLNEALSIAFQKYEKMKKHHHIILQAKVYLT